MAIIKTVDFSDFVREFELYGRGETFSRNGLRVLFDYLDETESYELDVIELCCEYSENSWQDIAANYSIDIEECIDDDDKVNAVREYLENETCIIDENDGVFVYQAF